MKRAFSTASSHLTKYSNLSSNERQRISQTSVGLYRILNKVISSHTRRESVLLLQPSIDHRDYGQARIIDAKKCITWKSMDTNMPHGVVNSYHNLESKIISFARHWTGKSNDDDDSGDEREIGDFNEMFGISAKSADENEVNAEEDFSDMSLYVSCVDLKNALRQGFDTTSVHGSLLKKEILDMQRFAIDSITLFEEQVKMFERTSISVDEERKIRVIAVSKCIGVSSTGPRFAYRIRIENFNEPDNDDENENNNDDVKEDAKNTSFQLLGRTWKIVEDRADSQTSLTGESSSSNNKEVVVDAPNTGAVGHLPVIHPGEVFEYMSGCELATVEGHMEGSFHMASVDRYTTSAQVGDPVEAFKLPADRRFKLPVEPFKLVANEN